MMQRFDDAQVSCKMSDDMNVTTSSYISPSINGTENTAGGMVGQSISTSQMVYIIIGIVGFAGNGITIAVLGSSKDLRSKTTNMLILNQSSIDCLSSIFLVAQTSGIIPKEAPVGFAGELFCRLWLSRFLLWGCFKASTFNLVALTLERYFQINYPIKHKTSFGQKEALYVMAFVWILGMVYQGLLSISSSGLVNGRCKVHFFWPSAKIQAIVGVLSVVIEFFIPLLIMILAYSKMAISILKKAKGVGVNSGQLFRGAGPSGHSQNHNTAASGLSSQNLPSQKMQQAGRNILKTLILISICFVICWAGNQTIFLLFYFGYPTKFNGIFYNVSVYLVFANCCTNPFIYAFKYKHFQKQLAALFGRKKVAPETAVGRDSGGHEKKTERTSM